MSYSPDTSRRRLLSLFAGAPMLPLASSLSAAGLLTACGGDDSDNGRTFKSVSFTATPAPSLANAAAMATTYTTSVMSVNYDDGSKTDFKLAYQPFFITGDMVPGTAGTILAGGYVDIHNQPIIDRTVPGSERQFFSDSPDGTSLLKIDGAKVPGVKGNTVFAVVQFEYTTWALDGKTDMYGKLPSPIAVLTLDQDKDTGKLTLVKYHNVDTSSVNGLWITCGASLSPWNTHLSSEEYEPDAFADRAKNLMNDFSKNLYGNPATANPYNYGHLPEVTVNADGTGSIKKHYCLGRISHELVQVMPDNRTVFMGDDATNSGYFVFVADKEKDLSAGTLYVAKVGGSTDFTKVGSAAAPLSWIKLRSATSAEIRALVDGGIRPADILTVASKDPSDPSFTRIVANGKVEWVKLAADTPAVRKAAAFLETHRYAALMGASMGFTKMEGTTVNIRDKKAYSALQNIQSSMVAGNDVNVPGNGISVPKQLVAGGVMELSLRGGQKDLGGADIKSDWMPADSKPLLVGQDLLDTDGKTLKPDALGNTASPDTIANPDNLKFSEALRTLFIGEDSGQHVTNMLWAYNVDSKQLSRLMTLPAGAESTGLHAVTDINGWTYIMSNFQHAGEYVKTINADVKTAVDGLIRSAYKGKFGSAVGYLTGSPTAVKLQG